MPYTSGSPLRRGFGCRHCHRPSSSSYPAKVWVLSLWMLGGVHSFSVTSHLSRKAFLPALQSTHLGSQRRHPLFSTTTDENSKNTNEKQQQLPENEEGNTRVDPEDDSELAIMEQLAREWSAMNRDSSSSTMSDSIGDSHRVAAKPNPPENKKTAVDTSTQQMNQLAREWMTRNRDEDTILPLPEDAMANLPAQQQLSPFSSTGGREPTNAFRGQQRQEQQQPPQKQQQQHSPSSMNNASPHRMNGEAFQAVERPKTTAAPKEIVTESPLNLEGQGMHVTQDNDAEDDDNNDKYVLIGKRLDQDPELRLVMSEAAMWKYFRKERPSFFGKLPLALLIDRTWDTIEDILVHLRRIPYEKGWVELTEQEELTRKTVVVLGSGWAAHALMKVADCNKLRLVIVSPSNHFVFTPMLASAAVGTVEYRSMTEAVRAANPMISEYLEGAATAINVQDKTVTVQLNPLPEVAIEEAKGLVNGSSNNQENSAPVVTLQYDNLVVAVGARVDDRGVPGAEKCLRLKTTDDAKRLRNAVGQALEYASRPNLTPEERARRVTILIVGGGPTGVELAGELHDLFGDVTRAHKGTYPRLAGVCKVILVHGGPDLVTQFSPALRKEALQALEKKGVQVILNTRVINVGDTSAKLSTKVMDPTTGKPTGERMDYSVPMGLAVWCAGTAPVPFVEELLKQLPPEARSKDGRVCVDRWMRPPMIRSDLLGSILVLGDAAAAVDEQGQGSLLPSTAQVAGQQGAFVARLLDRNYDLTTTPPELYHLRDRDVDEEAADLLARQWGKTDGTSSAMYLDKDNVFYDPSLALWLRFRGLELAPSFDFLNLGMLAYLGGGEALSQVQVGQVPILAWAGSVAFVLWRSVYLVKQVATRNRVLVTFDWIKSSLFGRDTTRL